MPVPPAAEIEIEPRVGYLYVAYGGVPITLEMIVQIINRVGEEIRKGGFDRVLLVRNAPLLDSDSNRELIAALVRGNVSPDVRFAIVDGFGNDPAKVAKAVEASRRTGWDLTGFDTVEEAEHWLRTV